MAGLLVLSIGMHGLGVIADHRWSSLPNNINQHPERLWLWVESPPIYNLKLALADFLSEPNDQRKQSSHR
jgi:hypothetical protein